MTVKINVIGTPSITINGSQLMLPLKKVEGIIYYLAIEGKASREKLASIFWSDKDEDSAYNNFRNALYLLRNKLPEEIFHSDRREVSLSKGYCDLDFVEDFSDLQNKLPENLYDELLSGFDIPKCAEFDTWLLTVRTQYKASILEKLKKRIAACYESGDDEALEDALRCLFKIDPLDEDSTLELMDLYFKRGDMAQASSLYKQYKKKLAEDLSIVPSTRAEEYYKRMVVSDTSAYSKDESPDSCFIGRHDEQKLILENMENAHKRTTVIFIDGEAGLGKTSLIHKMSPFINEKGNKLFSTRSYEAGIDYPYSSWSHLATQAEQYCKEKPLDDENISYALLASAFPNFMSDRRESHNVDSVVVSSEKTPIQIGRAVGRLVCYAASGLHPVIIIEDIHWFDKESMQMLEVFIANLTVPCTIFITSRPEKSTFVMRTMTRLKENGLIDFLHISMQPFDLNETASFCQRFLDKKIIAAKEVDYFYKESEGVPLLISEMIKTLKTNADAEFTESGLGGVMLARFGEISEKSRDFLRILSVFTKGATIESIAGIMSEQPDEVYPIAEELLNRHLIREVLTSNKKSRIEFCHAVLRSYIYDSIPGFKLSEYHKKVAELLNRSFSPEKFDPALSSMLCYHYTQAGLKGNVLQQHLREMIFDITLNHSLFPLIQDDVLYYCNLPYNSRSDTEKKMEDMGRLLSEIKNENYEESNKEILRMEAAFLELSGNYYVCWGEYEKAKVLMARSMKISREYSFHMTYIHCLANMGHFYLQTDNAAELMRVAREMLRVARQYGQDKFMGMAMRFIGVAFQISGEHRKSEAALNRSIAIFNELAMLGEHYTLSMLSAECYIGENYQWQGDCDKAEEHFLHCISVCEEKGLFWCCSHFHAHLADLAFDMGDMDLVAKNICRGVEVFEKTQGGRCGSMLYSLKSIVDAINNRYDDAYHALEIGEMLSAPIRKRSWIAVHDMAKAYLANMMEDGTIPPLFSKILTKSAKWYAAEAIRQYAQMPYPSRVNKLRDKFSIY